MIPLSLIPLPWKIGAAALLAGALVAAGAAYHHHVYQSGYDAAVTARAAQDAAAVFHRVQDNVAVAAKNEDINKFLTKAKNEELAPVVQRIYVDRVRVGPSICGGPSSPAKADDAGRSDSADPAGRLVSSAAEDRIRELDVEVEKHLATGRTCQAWGREHGFIQ